MSAAMCVAYNGIGGVSIARSLAEPPIAAFRMQPCERPSFKIVRKIGEHMKATDAAGVDALIKSMRADPELQELRV